MGRAIGLLSPAWPGRAVSNGIVTAVHNLAHGLLAAGHRPVIVTARVDGEGPAGIPVIPVAAGRPSLLDRLRHRLGDAEAPTRSFAAAIAGAVSEAVRAHGIEALLMEESFGWAGLVQDRVAIPVVAVLHGPWLVLAPLQSGGDPAEDARRERAEAASLRRVSGILSPSRAVLDAVRAGVALPAALPVAVVPNAIAAGDPPPEGRDATILFVGRFDLTKGGDTVLEAWARLAARRPGARLVFAGPDHGVARPDGTRLALGAALGALPADARSRVRATGPLDRAAVAALRARHGIALIASRYENLNYTLLESMAAGQAIVCTAVGGPAEVLEDGATALLVPPEDPEAMAAALGRLLDDPALAGRLGAAARARVLRDFAPEAVAARTIRFVEGLARGAPPRDGPRGAPPQDGPRG